MVDLLYPKKTAEWLIFVTWVEDFFHDTFHVGHTLRASCLTFSHFEDVLSLDSIFACLEATKFQGMKWHSQSLLNTLLENMFWEEKMMSFNFHPWEGFFGSLPRFGCLWVRTKREWFSMTALESRAPSRKSVGFPGQRLACETETCGKYKSLQSEPPNILPDFIRAVDWKLEDVGGVSPELS